MRARTRAPKVVETAEFVAFARRILAAMGKRAAFNADNLGVLSKLSGDVDAAMLHAVAAARAEGYSWADIGRELGTTRQAAQQRFGHRLPPTEAA
jgi:hypothetical protein